MAVFPEKRPEFPVSGGKSSALSVQLKRIFTKPEKRRSPMNEILRKRTNLAAFFTIIA